VGRIEAVRCLAIDTETTGLSESRLRPEERQPYIIEFCGILTDLASGATIEEYTTFVRPPRLELMTEKIVDLTRITVEMVAASPSFIKVADKIKEMIESAEMVAAHNLSFDKHVIDTEFKRLGRTIKWPSRLICTVEQTVHLKGFRLDLSSLHETLLGIKFQDAHRADVDTKALVRCLVEMHLREWL